MIEVKRVFTRHRLKMLLITSLLFLVFAAITAQVFFNMFVWDRLKQNDMIPIQLGISTALQNLHDLKSAPDSDRRISEVGLQLSSYTENPGSYRYSVIDSEDNSRFIQITSLELHFWGMARLLYLTQDDLGTKVAEAQACNRGFTITLDRQVDESYSNELTEVGQKTLLDGRLMRIYQEKNCHYESMNDIAQTLMQIESYRP